MRISSKGRLAIGILVVAGVAALVIVWALRQGNLPTAPAEITGTHPHSPTNAAEKPGETAGDDATATAANANAAAEKPVPELPTADETPEQPTWEDRLDQILLADGNEDEKSDKIIALMPYAPPDAQEELSQHLVNMTQDTHYDGASNLLMNLNTSTNVQEVLLNDLLNRNNTLKLNTLLRVLETPSHPLQQNAKDMLELFVQEDHGTNMAAWEKAVGDWLKENEAPAEAQAAPAPDAPQAQ